mmetsp:Transcript_44938/g.106706  ORF Transcript_44938/g.106706 Transcript_44938/m.106706 type:complete len:523 (+) Transcript_44938:109-1677(+)|eukprot:CAMPEP_0178411012 /NCGR_PEP_ID=MMETSP0689_2-20121128/21277_1 /TAXON_ID=160604 /ORGANISM="Amphidinium massartii, Strain CS-259" /LENGTH=522 /DNA_ID=CAMNT_0020032209 /DNA_START=109 /DNA_END=1677 /DNA_ORIENTATION=-
MTHQGYSLWQCMLPIASLLLGVVNADLPVHCLRHEVVGDWRFTLGALAPQRSSCGHARPDVEDKQPARDFLGSHGVAADVFMVTLDDPNKAYAGGMDGRWTMIYDEGFEVSFDNVSFFAFSNFTLDAQHRNTSHCDSTMVGWYSNANRTQFGCYYGEKVSGIKTSRVLAQEENHHQDHFSSSRRRTGVIDHQVQHDSVKKLNKRLSLLQMGWKAREMEKWNGRTIQEVNEYVGLRRHSHTVDLHREMLRQREGPRSFLQRSRRRQLSANMPESFDWGDVNGINYLEPVMDQADCGSCYAASSVRMLTARHKITRNDTSLLPWSISFPLHCSEYNQGCKGGYGFLLSKWSSEVGLLPATCMRYSTSGTCKLECDLKELQGKRYRVANHRYVGSYYGNANEKEIMHELYHNGPLAVGLQPDEDFMYYSEGVYRASGAKPASTGGHEWEQVDHGVLLVGWGVENGTKYWKIQNSWGPDWGEDGFFRIARGTDESHIESMAEAADVVEDDQDGRLVEQFFQQMSAM